MISETLTLADFGWNNFFSSQLDPTDSTSAAPVRVVAVHRDRLHVVGPKVDTFVPPFTETDGDEESVATVGDWLLLNAAMTRASGSSAAVAFSSAVPQAPAANCNSSRPM